MAEITECMLTTRDNPYNPFTNFREWYLYDVKNNYNTCALIARLSPYNTDELSPGEQHRENERVIDEILKNVDFMKMYKKVYNNAS